MKNYFYGIQEILLNESLAYYLSNGVAFINICSVFKLLDKKLFRGCEIRLILNLFYFEINKIIYNIYVSVAILDKSGYSSNSFIHCLKIFYLK